VTPAPDYSPDRRTALVLLGTGAHGAYHAGVLRALEEAGVRLDVVAGRGVGAGAAMLTAIDGAASLWDTHGVWRRPDVRSAYTWQPTLRYAAWAALALVAVLVVPLLLLTLGLVVYPIGFLLEVMALPAGPVLVNGYSAWVQSALSSPNLPTVLPRVGLAVLVGLVGILLAGTAATAWRTTPKRRAAGGWWWSVFGAPIDATVLPRLFADALWQLVRGAQPVRRPDVASVGRRFVDTLVENLGQPGVRELLLVATDLDARQDVTGAVLKEPYRTRFFDARAEGERRSEAIDLAASGQSALALEMLFGALAPPFGSESHRIRFAPASYWRGETRRYCDRPAAVLRVFEELHAAGVQQVVVVGAAVGRPAPHGLAAVGLSPWARLGDMVTADETAALRDAITAHGALFRGIYQVAPVHNPVGPFDLGGAYDRASDRHYPLAELLDLGYEDAYRQFITPVIGGSGEHLGAQADAFPGQGDGEEEEDILDRTGPLG